MSHHWRIGDNSFIVISPDAVRKMQSYRQKSLYAREAGGVIYGYDRNPHLHLLGVTTPQPKDLRRRSFWKRQDEQHLSLLNEEQRSLGVSYLGEWHTHPEKYPTPSELDVGEWRKLMRLNPEQKHIFIICGQHSLSVFHGLNGCICPVQTIARELYN